MQLKLLTLKKKTFLNEMLVSHRSQFLCLCKLCVLCILCNFQEKYIMNDNQKCYIIQ